MIDIDRDFTLDASGDVRLISGSEAARQRLENRLQTNQGEWVFNTLHGVPWLVSILGQSGDSAGLRELLVRQIAQDPEVESISQFDAAFDNVARKMTYTVKLRMRDGSSSAVTL